MSKPSSGMYQAYRGGDIVGIIWVHFPTVTFSVGNVFQHKVQPFVKGIFMPQWMTLQKLGTNALLGCT